MFARAGLRRLGLSAALLHGFVDQGIHSELHNHRQIPVRHPMTQQLRELLQLVVQSLSSCELHFVSPRPEWHRRPARPLRLESERRSASTNGRSSRALRQAGGCSIGLALDNG
jgi:hypothetical protein